MTDSLHSDQDHHAVRDSPKGLGRSTNTSRSDSVTCPACHVTVTLSKNTEGRRRLVCPYCGATYNHHESQIRVMPTPTADPLRHLRLPIVVEKIFHIYFPLCKTLYVQRSREERKKKCREILEI